MYDIIHPPRKNLTSIRGYVRLGGLPDNPRTDPQDRAWFGPHDRLFTDEESDAIDFLPGPEHGKPLSPSNPILVSPCSRSMVLGMGRCRRSRWTRRRPHLGTSTEQEHHSRLSESQTQKGLELGTISVRTSGLAIARRRISSICLVWCSM